MSAPDVRSWDEDAKAEPLAPVAFALCVCATPDGPHDDTQRVTDWLVSPEAAWRDRVYYTAGNAHVIPRYVFVGFDPTEQLRLSDALAHGRRKSFTRDGAA